MRVGAQSRIPPSVSLWLTTAPPEFDELAGCVKMWRAKMARLVADDRGRIDAPSINVADQGLSERRCPSAALRRLSLSSRADADRKQQGACVAGAEYSQKSSDKPAGDRRVYQRLRAE
jgi:hypothetical protein